MGSSWKCPLTILVGIVLLSSCMAALPKTSAPKYDKEAVQASLDKTAADQAKSQEQVSSVLQAAVDKLPKASPSQTLKKVEIAVEGGKGMNKGAGVFQPAGFQLSEDMEYKEPIKETKTEADLNPSYGFGIGGVIMSGCFGRNYTKGDPCYSFASANPYLCKDLLDGVMFMGVGFDISETYTAESRRKGLLVQNCQEKRGFQDKDVPDNMLGDGIYEYKVETTSYESVGAYQKELASRAGVALTDSTFSKGMETISAGVSGGFGPISGGVKTSFSKGHESSQSQSSASSSASSQAASQKKKVYIAVLEADLLLYEIHQDSVKPDDLRSEFVKEYLDLPTNFYTPGAYYKFNDFILRWGTHYVKYAKFGGQLKIIKTKEATAEESFSTFQTRSEHEFQRSMATMSSASVQASVSTPWVSVEAGYAKSSAQGSSAGNAVSQEQKDLSSSYQQDAYASTLFEIEGGKPDIAKGIFDAYTPSFKEDFAEWLESVPDYAKPFDFKLGKITELLSFDIYSLMGTSCGMCKTSVDASCKVKEKGGEVEKTYTCKDLKAKQMALAKKRLSLQRAIEVYLKEGPISGDDSILMGGVPNCEYNQWEVMKKQTSFPTMQEIRDASDYVRIVFTLSRDIPGLLGIKANEVFKMLYTDGMWQPMYRGFIDRRFAFTSPKDGNKVIIRGLVLTYNSKTGKLTLSKDDVTASSTNMGGISLSKLSDKIVAYAQYTDPAAALTNSLPYGTFASMPCKYHWTNVRVFDNNQVGHCIRFSASSTGSIYLILAGVPGDTSTWYHVRISDKSVAVYKDLVLQEMTTHLGARGQGEVTLYQLYFVCVKETSGSTSILYGTSAEKDSTSLETWMDFTFKGRGSGLRYFTFGSGERSVDVMDVTLVSQSKLKFTCHGDLILKTETGRCEKRCHKLCDQTVSCKKSDDATACNKCVDKYVIQKDRLMVCVETCPTGTTLIGNECKGGCTGDADCKSTRETCTSAKCKCKTGYSGINCADGCTNNAECGARKVCSSNKCQCAPNTWGSSCAENWAVTSKGTTCSQSSVAYNRPCSAAIDGELADFRGGWISNRGSGNWIELKFTASITIQYIKLIPHCRDGRQMSAVTVFFNPGNLSKRYEGLTCYKGTDWNCATYGSHGLSVPNIKATSIKIRIDNVCIQDYSGLNEVLVYGIQESS